MENLQGVVTGGSGQARRWLRRAPRGQGPQARRRPEISPVIRERIPG